ncbi:hypothetical protein GGR16_000296 [Chelatococcus caeni]|uniref:Uncharacterized protein n=1 Tax=Chelatococcus caeni TaxID=1348468 RepID=A0A840BQN4_9HYPH|nr:hypothetical protein [Chelatococcus caeni]MBB4015290.1 hypothetical protein [Chelatococcus caeni]
MEDWIEHFRAATCGMSVSHVWRGYGSALFVEFGSLTVKTRRDGSPGEPQGDIGLMIEWSWRIEDENSIVCGSESDDDLWPAIFARLVGQRVIDLRTFGRLPEILLSLSGGLHVASFMTAGGDPAWALFDRRDQLPVAICCRSGVVVEDG